MRMKKLTSQLLDISIELFKAFADPVRLRLLNLLAAGEVCVCHLHEALELPQSTVSRHLAYLRKRGLVVARREGLWVG
jgi:ArsR family transcriptional regulator, arsenate/arsenite/antimonite-responsive transcriptional repressor